MLVLASTDATNRALTIYPSIIDSVCGTLRKVVVTILPILAAWQRKALWVWARFERSP